jgi:hypothetical protein
VEDFCVKIKAWLTLALGAPLLAACQSPPGSSAHPGAESKPLQTSQGRKAPDLDPAIEQRARGALAQAGIAQDLPLLTVDAVEWTDSSLGCRQPGQQYLQVITPGHVLRFGEGKPDSPVHSVHVAGEAAIVCSRALGTGVVQRPPRASRALGLDVIVVDARKDLADRLGLELEKVALHRILPMTFDDNRLGCEAPPSDELSPPVRGHQLLFQTSSGNFIYRTDGKRFAPCPPIAAQ